MSSFRSWDVSLSQNKDPFLKWIFCSGTVQVKSQAALAVVIIPKQSAVFWCFISFHIKKIKLPYSHFSDLFYLIPCSNFSWTFIAQVQIGNYHKRDRLNVSPASFLRFWGFASRHWQNGGCSTRLRPAGTITIWDGDKWQESEQAERGWPASCYHPLHYPSSGGSPFSPPPC